MSEVVVAPHMMDEPDDLVGVPQQVGGRADRDEAIGAIGCLHEPIGKERVEQDLGALIGGEIELLNLMTVGAQLLLEPIDDEAATTRIKGTKEEAMTIRMGEPCRAS